MNITIDDQYGDSVTGFIPVFLPNDGTWHVGSPSENCSNCKITPTTLDISQIHDHTWHDATHTPGLTPAQIIVNFTGTAVYVFNIVPNSLPGNTATFANISFTIDGSDAGSFVRAPDETTDVILYNQVIHSIVGLENIPHTLTMTGGGGTKALILFDYVVYTTEVDDTVANSTSSTQGTSATATSETIGTINPSTSTAIVKTRRSPIGAIVGAVVGGVIFVVLLGMLAVCYRRRKRKAQILDRCDRP